MPEQQTMGIDQPPDVHEQIAEIERELVVRVRVYPEWIERGKIKRAVADHRIRCLEETLGALRQLARLYGPEFSK